MVYGNFKILPRRTAYDKILRDETFNIAKTSKCDGYKQGIASLVYKFSWKISRRITNYTNQLLENLKNTHLLKAIFRGADPAGLQLISKYNKGFPIFIMRHIYF